MVDALTPVEGTQAVTVPRSVRATGAPTPFAVAAAPAGDALPAMPPAEVLDALDTAARVLHDLGRRNVHLHFEHDAETHQIRVQVQDGGGRVVREIPARRLLNILAGDTSALAVDTRE